MELAPMVDRISPFKAAKAARARGFNLHPISVTNFETLQRARRRARASNVPRRPLEWSSHMAPARVFTYVNEGDSSRGLSSGCSRAQHLLTFLVQHAVSRDGDHRPSCSPA
jgi:hypothetical protein